MDETAKKEAEFAFQEWKARLATRDRRKESLSGNFDELFEELKKLGIAFELAHEYLPKAIKAHLPSTSQSKATWENVKHSKRATTYPEFVKEWHTMIEDRATESFYDFFKRKKHANEDDDGEPKVFGNMSEKEYRAQRKIADSFQQIDTTELERQLVEREAFAETLVDDVLGTEDETN